MKLIKLTHYLMESNKIYINSDCILSCERLYEDDLQTPYTKVGLLYKNEFQFFQAKETIGDIQSQIEGTHDTKTIDNNQIEGKHNTKHMDNRQIGERIKEIRLAKGMNQKEFAKFTSVTVPGVYNWETGRNLPSKERLVMIADFAGITVQQLLEG